MNANEFRIWVESEKNDLRRSYTDRIAREVDREYKQQLYWEMDAKLEAYDSILEGLVQHIVEDQT